MIALYLACLEDAGDKRRFEEIWHACKRLVFHTAYTILRDEHLAEDVMQEAFFYLAQHFSSIDTADDRRVRRYLVLAARSRALDLLRLVAELPERDRIPLELAAQGMSGAGMAAALGVSEAAARKRLQRARARLWKELNRDE